MKKIILSIDGMTCSACSNGLEKYLNKQNGIINATVNLVMANATIDYDDNILNQEKIEKYIKQAGFSSAGIFKEFKIEKSNKKEKRKFITFTILAIILMYISMGHMINLPIPAILNPHINPLIYTSTLLILTILFLIYGFKIGTETYIPILKMYINIPEFLYIPLAIIVVLATTNAVNLTDGIDGLSSSVSAIIITCLTVIGISNQVYEVSIFGSIVIGATLGFLMFNLHPAKVFMGDTGSLMLGGVISGLALYLKMPLLLILIAIIPVLETLSVIIQVAYFKKTGNRIFKMAPLHHHFELSGWKENKVVVVFSLITLIACFIGLKIV